MSSTEGLVEIAVYAIEHFAGKNVDRATAEKAFVLWHGYEFVTRATRDAVLAHFPVVEPEPVAGFDFLADPDDEPEAEIPAPRMVCGTWPRSMGAVW